MKIKIRIPALITQKQIREIKAESHDNLPRIIKNSKIKTAGIKQYFYPRDKFEVGISQSTFQNTSIRIYDRERMLIELIKNKDKLPFDYYKEVIENYRKLVDSLDIERIQDYVMSFPGSDSITRAIQLEVL